MTEHSTRGLIAKNWPYAASTAFMLLAVSACVGLFVTWQAGGRTFGSYVLSTLDPMLASVSMLLLCLVAPNVYSGRRFKLPHVVAHPTIFVAAIYALKVLARSSATDLQGIEGARRFDAVWLDPKLLLWTWVLLALAGWITGALLPDEGDEAVE